MSSKKYSSIRVKELDEPKRLVDNKVYDDEVKRTFGKNVRAARKKKGISQIEFSKMTGINQARVSTIERGVFPDSPGRVVAIANALDVSLDWLFGRIEKEKQ